MDVSFLYLIEFCRCVHFIAPDMSYWENGKGQYKQSPRTDRAD